MRAQEFITEALTPKQTAQLFKALGKEYDANIHNNVFRGKSRIYIPLPDSDGADIPQQSATQSEVQKAVQSVGYNIDDYKSGIASKADDPNRKISPIQQNRAINSSTFASAQYAPSPYNISILLYIYAKNQDDGLQILEQIIPFFNPDFNITIKDLPEMNAKRDIMIVLNNIRYEDVYEGGYTQRRTLMWDLAFTMKLNFFGLVSNQNIIKIFDMIIYFLIIKIVQFCC